MSEASSKWQAVVSVLREHSDNPDIQAARVVYSAVAAHELKGPPVWPMLVGPPGSLKTELLYGLRCLPKAHFIDQITAKTFISGYIDDKNPRGRTPTGLLHRIGNDGLIVCLDFSTILAIHGDHRASIFSDFRRIYDGDLAKEFGTTANLQQRAWKGRITFMAAATDAVDRHYGVFQSLGERFLMARWPRPDGTAAAMRAMNQDHAQARADLQAAVKGLLHGLPPNEPSVPEDIQLQLAGLADLTARGRTHIYRDNTKNIDHVPEAESSTRLAQQFAQLAKASALLDRRDSTNADDYALVVRVAFDSLPPTRRKVLDALIAGKAADDAFMPASTRSYAIQDLNALGLYDNGLTPLALRLLGQAGVQCASQAEREENQLSTKGSALGFDPIPRN